MTRGATGFSGDPRVLVVGPRRGLCAALAHEGIAHVVWSAQDRKRPTAEAVHVAPIAKGRRTAKRQAAELGRYGPFSHVIAGTEGAVVAAALARRVLGARCVAETIVIRCHDKLEMKRYLVDHGIPMTDFLDGREELPPEEIMRRLGVPVVLKARSLSGGRGIDFISDAGVLARTTRRGRLLERYVDAPEVSVESFVNHGEVLFENITEYARKGHVNVLPAGLAADDRAAVLDLNRRVLQALNVQWGMTHVEMYLTATGPMFGEIALRPPGGYIMELLELVYGFDPWRAFVSVEVDRGCDLPAVAGAHAASIVLHPGEGTVREVRGLDEVRSLSGVVDARVRVAAGDRVARRDGVGNDVGRIIVRAHTREALFTAWTKAEATLRIDMQ